MKTDIELMTVRIFHINQAVSGIRYSLIKTGCLSMQFAVPGDWQKFNPANFPCLKLFGEVVLDQLIAHRAKVIETLFYGAHFEITNGSNTVYDKYQMIDRFAFACVENTLGDVIGASFHHPRSRR